MLDYTTDFEVVWSGGMANDPLGGASKGCLLAPREQTEDERHINACRGAVDIEMSMAELERAVHRMNATLKQPVEFGRVFGEGKNGTYGRTS